MKFFKDNTVINWHEHVTPDGAAMETIIRDMDMAGFDVCCVSGPYATKHHVTEVMEANNNMVARTMELYPGRIEGFAFLDSIHGRHAVKEIY